MTARLDHVGIAVQDVAAALAFFRDALGLPVHGVEEVASQAVRAHFVSAGNASLELLEATSDTSPIARYLGKRGPGLHHLTLRVTHLQDTLDRLRARGVRLIDEVARPGAEQAMVAFIHPSAAHGVLVELKEAPPAIPRFRSTKTLSCGALQLTTLDDGFLHLDGGAMFGVVPRPLWEKRLPADDRHRITLAMRPLLVRGERTLLIDAGCGDKMSARDTDIYGLERDSHLDHALAAAGVGVEEIDIVVASHLHFDHVGGFTQRQEDGTLVPRFPRARYVVHRGEWEDATHPHERNRASYLAENFAPLAAAGVLDLVDDEAEPMAGVRLRRSGGHTQHHQVIMLQSQGETAVFAADMLPTAAHLPDAWIMGYDLYPMDTLVFKRSFVREAIAREYLVFFEHDPSLAAGRIREQDGRRTVERVV